MTQQTIVAHFKSRDAAEDAREALVEEGVMEGAIRIYPDVAVEGYSNGASAYDAVRDEGGFWASLANLFMPDRDRYAYAEGMSRGGATLSVTADQPNVEQVTAILERHGPVDMEEQEASWRSEGWTGHATGTDDAPVTTYSGGGRVRSYGAEDALASDGTAGFGSRAPGAQ